MIDLLVLLKFAHTLLFEELKLLLRSEVLLLQKQHASVQKEICIKPSLVSGETVQLVVEGLEGGGGKGGG